ncbi:hypothetical protein QFC21_005473 [Naganishia friedmannii]|uniref:Uncharacterized protein n=1 Tax=Naganishia friedmannii TaxID=89922 RepID=A0ACC2V8J1_9TREE|nr:hypothetical protein QFC21_005473 [Naganishia friedmannii]
MSFSARTRRSNLSNKVPNVKLRPAPVLSKSSSNNLRRLSKYADGEEEIGLMDKEVIRRLNEADDLAGEPILYCSYSVAVRGQLISTERADENSEDAELEHARPSRPFEKRTICFTAIQSPIKADLIKKLTAMGVSKVEGNLTMETSALIGETFDSVKYRAAVQNRIPVYTPEWIDTIHSNWLSGMDIPDIFSKVYRQFYLPPFADLKIAISGIEPGTSTILAYSTARGKSDSRRLLLLLIATRRTAMMEKITSMGGVYSKTLDPSCTHLLIAQPILEENESVDLDAIRTAKVDWALRRNAKAEQARRRRAREIQAGRLEEDSAEPRNEEKMIIIVWEGWFWDCVEFGGRFSEDRWRLENQPTPPTHAFSEREQERLAKKRDEKLRKEEEERERLLRDMMAEDVKLGPSVKAESHQNEDVFGEVDMQRLKNVPDTELEPAKLRKRPRPTSFANNTKNDSRMALVDELMSSMGVKAEPESGPQPLDSSRSPGHVNPPDNAPLPMPSTKPEENGSQGNRTRKRARLATAGPSQPSVTSTGLAPRPLAPERFSVAHTSRASAFNESNAANSKPILLAQKSNGGTQPASMAKRQSVADMVEDTSLNPSLFKDLVFSHDVDSGYQAMEAAIIGSGGKLVSLDDVRNGADVDYLISRVERVATVISKLKSKTTRVTESWIEMCLTENRLIPPEEHVAYKPLSAPMPVPGLLGKAIHLSGYQETSELWILRRLVRAFGAEVPLQLSKRGTTYLVCKEPGNPKHFKAIQWGLPAVRQDWLFHVAKTGDASTEGFELPVPSQWQEDGRSSANSIDTRRALGANNTANMSMLPEQGSFFGMSEASDEKSRKTPAQAEHGSEQSSVWPSKPPSQLSSASRQLGLAPTVLDLGPMISEPPAQITDMGGHGSQQSKSSPMVSVDGQPLPSIQLNSALRADTGPSERPGTTKSLMIASGGSASNSTSGKLSSTTSAPAELIENMIKQLAPEKPHNVVKADFPIRRRRVQSKTVSTSTKSGSASPAKLAEPLNVMFKSGAGPVETQQTHETAEESFRVQYRDPAAEKERQKLLAGFRDKEPDTESPRTTRSRAR